jgi:hypothetical protein
MICMYPLLYIIRIVKEDEMEGHVAGMQIFFCWQNLKEID